MSDKHFPEDAFDLEQYKKNNEDMKNFKFKKKSHKLINIFTCIILLAAVVLIFFLFILGKYFYDVNNAKEINKKTKIIAAQINSATPEPTPMPTASPEPTPRPIREEFLKLREEFKNEDIVAYLKIENSTIDYPIVQYTDNDFYLSRDLKKNESIAGSIFMDFRNNPEGFDNNTVIYGHNMRAQTMFHDLRYYIDEEYYKNHKNILLKTLYENSLWEIFSFYKTDVNFNYIQTHFQDSDEFAELVQAMKEKSLYETVIEVSQNDKILTLSTCTNEEDNTRYVAHAKLLTVISANEN